MGLGSYHYHCCNNEINWLQTHWLSIIICFFVHSGRLWQITYGSYWYWFASLDILHLHLFLWLLWLETCIVLFMVTYLWWGLPLASLQALKIQNSYIPAQAYPCKSELPSDNAICGLVIYTQWGNRNSMNKIIWHKISSCLCVAFTTPRLEFSYGKINCQQQCSILYPCDWFL